MDPFVSDLQGTRNAEINQTQSIDAADERPSARRENASLNRDLSQRERANSVISQASGRMKVYVNHLSAYSINRNVNGDIH